MKKTRFTKILSFILCLVLVAAIALFSVGCNDNNTVGTGDGEFTFAVTHSNGEKKTFTVKTDKETVGEALVDEGLISGVEGPYGLVVETVDGETVRFEDDGKYWAFYINGEYAMSGVDATEITAGTTYSFKVE